MGTEHVDDASHGDPAGSSVGGDNYSLWNKALPRFQRGCPGCHRRSPRWRTLLTRIHNRRSNRTIRSATLERLVVDLAGNHEVTVTCSEYNTYIMDGQQLDEVLCWSIWQKDIAGINIDEPAIVENLA